MKNKLLLVTDAWEPQINGVVRTLKNTIHAMHLTGEWDILVVDPSQFSVFSLPGYKEIQISYNVSSKLSKIITDYVPDYIHIAVEGPLGIAARKYCLKHGYKFTTAYHSKFPEFIEARIGINSKYIYPFFRWFHAPSSNLMTAFPELSDELRARGFQNEFGHWTRGVDTNLFNPQYRDTSKNDYALFVGRVSHEKNIAAFLDAKTQFKKVVVGDGPQLNELKAKYPNVSFVGAQSGVALSSYYASASVFVFPSKTDTFGLVMIEALACGTPVAAYDVFSPNAIITDEIGALSDNLSNAITIAATKGRITCRDHVLENYTWGKATEQFILNLIPIM